MAHVALIYNTTNAGLSVLWVQTLLRKKSGESLTKNSQQRSSSTKRKCLTCRTIMTLAQASHSPPPRWDWGPRKLRKTHDPKQILFISSFSLSPPPLFPTLASSRLASSSPPLLGQSSSILQHSLFDDVPTSFLHHDTFHLKLFPKPFAFLPGDPSFLPFNFRSSRIPGREDPLLFEDQDSFEHVPILLSLHFAPACIDSSSLVPVFAAHNPNTFCTK